MSSSVVPPKERSETSPHPRRDFLSLTAVSMGLLGGGLFLLPLMSSLGPSADIRAISSIEVDIGRISEGESLTVMWRGKPVFIRHRTGGEILKAREVASSSLPDPEDDHHRVREGKEQWLVVVGICTHFGCIPVKDQGDYEGWFCPCHGSHYDISGRIRRGPAPKNLLVPPYEFISDTRIRIG